MTATLLGHHIAPTPPDAPHQPADEVTVRYLTDTGLAEAPTVVRECVQGPSGRWMVTVDAPPSLPARHADARPGLFCTTPALLTPTTEGARP